MPKRVAITIAGAVSLGSYEAGVSYELFEAIRRHNEAAATDEAKIYVDVITGASAGGMTAAMLAQWLMFDGGSMSDPVGNPLYQAWVKTICLENLVKLQPDENVWHSLFSSNLITKIGTTMLVDSMKRPGLSGPHACLEPGAVVRVGIALTNLVGIDYMIPIVGSDEGGFNYTRSADQQRFVVHPNGPAGPVISPSSGPDIPATWVELRDAAVASGAFPFAFRPRGVPRRQAEFVNATTPLWPGHGKPNDEGTTYVVWGDNEPDVFAYADGGVLQNQPLGIAKDLVDAGVAERLESANVLLASGADEAEAAQKKAHQDADDRLYVFISPNEVKSTANALKADEISMRGMIPAILGTYQRQATFHDWIVAEGVNQKIRLLDDRAKQLAEEIENGRVRDLGCLGAASGNLNELLLGDEAGATLTRLRHQYEKLYGDLLKKKGKVAADAFISAIATLEKAAELGDSDKMHIIAVLADGKTELAGSGMSAFVGFFDAKFREHDYLVGRIKARTYLQRKDVQAILKLNLAAMEAGWQPLGDPKAIVQVPLSLKQQWRAGRKWLLYGISLRIPRWVKIGVSAVLGVLVYVVLAHQYRWWPF